ncbi:hypothetical protein PTSG_12187 [Salpingoeca rosetta]|uniref:Uncharacterized protein n=1 Tax=Salpingoeca rosetta (strain ATCC 50818 / BSB-021) TaxID=946362 RepID=F2U8T2_SALR5|nr:uncharacterized protein PTSG_12187 [Salpingoeca rosetta]EGD72790.1 hypothetical protein PTSG_12187 [Salpingoeca rosetta]|eukprot:XP_004994613.1 hypothetical protein PTSG_12187 [Salpingoeca rosetta]
MTARQQQQQQQQQQYGANTTGTITPHHQHVQAVTNEAPEHRGTACRRCHSSSMVLGDLVGARELVLTPRNGKGKKETTAARAAASALTPTRTSTTTSFTVTANATATTTTAASRAHEQQGTTAVVNKTLPVSRREAIARCGEAAAGRRSNKEGLDR